jgi:hypothetical protein
MVLCMAPAPSTAPVALKFKDSATCRGLPAVQYHALEFRDRPVRPIEGRKFPAGAKYSLVPLGPKPELGLLLVWVPNAPGGPELWLDANADGKLSDDERHVLKGKTIEIPATVTVQWTPKPVRVQRTLMFRRSATGDGLRYAVRGYAEGRLKLGDKEYDVALLDGNGNGCFDRVGHDRLWIDLDGDGRFDLLTEQYPLGKPIQKDGAIYVVRSDPLAHSVVVNLRSQGEGKLRLRLAGKTGSPAKVAAELVSDIGEFVSIDKLDECTAVPYGEYRFANLMLEVPDADGKTWTFYFRAERERNFAVPVGQETTIPLMSQFEVNAQSELLPGEVMIRPGQQLNVRPEVIADGSLSLSRCSFGAKGQERPEDSKAEVVLLGPDGQSVHRSVDGFG